MPTAPANGRRLAAATLAAACVLGCRTDVDRPVATPAAAPASSTTWQKLGTWSGGGDRQTDSFDVTTGALQMQWTARETTPGAGRLRVSLHSAISGRPLQTVLDVRGSGASEVYFEDEPRVSYLVVEAADVDWRVELLQAAAGRPPRPTP
jgi:hypothetical protein